MRPSLLLKGLMAAKTTEPQETDDCATTPDQQVNREHVGCITFVLNFLKGVLI